MFGYAKVMGKVSAGDFIDGKFTGKVTLSSFVKGRTYDDIAVFVIDDESLDKGLYRADALFKGETAYEGVIATDAIPQMVCIPVTKKLETFVGSVLNAGLTRYVGIDIVKHLGAKTFDIV
jgi:hypothetical protein